SREAAAERSEESERAAHPQPSPQDRAEQAGFLRQKPEPRARVSVDPYVRAAHVSVVDLDRAVVDLDRRAPRDFARERELHVAAQALGACRQERNACAGEEAIDRGGAEPVADALGALAREAARDMALGLRSGDDVDGFFLVLEWADDVADEGGAIGEK